MDKRNKTGRAIRGLSVFLCGVLAMGLGGCGPRESASSDPGPSKVEFDIMNRDYLYGIGEPLFLRVANGEANIQKSVELMAEMGVKSFRLWMSFSDILNKPDEVDTYNAGFYHTIIEECKKKGILVMGMSHYIGYKGGQFAAPRRDMDKDSDYQKYMRDFETSWETMAKTFPDVLYWQLGNENNGDMFMHPIEFEKDKTTVFTYQEKADIVTDMMYYGSRGLHKGNPDAQAVMPPMSPYESEKNAGLDMGVVDGFLELLYKNIESGNWPSKDPDDFFQVLSWNPYFLQGGPSFEEEPNQHWVECNNKIYDVAKKHGDGDKPVIFSEFGYSDRGLEGSDKLQGDYIYNALELVEKQMPYVKMFHVFRLYDDPRAFEWGGNYQVYFGLFHVEEDGRITPKEKGLGYVRYTNKDADLKKFAQ